MRAARKSRLLQSIPLLMTACLCFSGCLEIEAIEQPSSVVAGGVFDVSALATVSPGAEGGPYCGMCLPVGWTIPGNAIAYAGIHDGTIIYDAGLALEQERLSPAPEGYYWWVGCGDVTETEEGPVLSTFQIQTDEQTGIFSIDYVVGNSRNGLNQLRSDGHLIEVIGASLHPTGLQTVVEDESVLLSWLAPSVNEGLTGYLVYRDGEVINTGFVMDTVSGMLVYSDDDPGVGIHKYTVASLYNDGAVYSAPETLEVFVCAGGAGKPDDPFRIATAGQLIAVGSHPSLLEKHYVLMSDVDLDPDLPRGQIFDRAVIAPDASGMEEGFQGLAFNGTFDGNDYTVSNLTIEGSSYLGLFGALGPDAHVMDLTVVDVDVAGHGRSTGVIAGSNSGTVQACYSSGLATGYSYVGGLAGSNDGGQILDSHSTADVVGIEYVGGLVGSSDEAAERSSRAMAVCGSHATGTVFGWQWVGGLIGFNQGTVSKCSSSSIVSGSSFLGGLAGYNHLTGLLSNCYSSSTVRGDDTLGGLVGANMGRIRFAYSTGEVIGASHTGGLVGQSAGQTEVTASFWDVEASGLLSSDAGAGLTTAELQDINTYLDTGWDFAGERDNGTDNIWYMTVDRYPGFFSFQGTGTRDDPYQIDTVWHLTSIGSDHDMLDKHFKLTAHIDLDPNQLGSRVFTRAVIAPDLTPYDDSYGGTPFSGTFDGCGYEIRNMRIKGTYCLGLFGWAAPEAHVSNLSVVSAHVEVGAIGPHPKGHPLFATSQGLLAGANQGEVQMCHTSGSISELGTWTGGLIGYNLGNVRHCTSSAHVQGTATVGGLVGYHDEGQITNCSSTGTVEQERISGQVSGSRAGGLVGESEACISRCYATGVVNSEGWAGGLVGENQGTVEKCYSTCPVAGGGHVGGLVGINRTGEITECYSIGPVTGGSDVGGLVGSNDWIVTHSFWDTETSGQSSSAGGFGMTTAQMHDINTFSSAGWDFFGREFDGTEDTWVMETYPVLFTSQLPGRGTVESPYLISQENRLIAFKNMLPSAHYRLAENIDLSGIQWEAPLVEEYSGTFDGAGFSLRNLTMIAEEGSLAPFGTLDHNGTIKNLKLGNVLVKGGRGAKGGLVERNYGSITHCQCSGVVTGNELHVGGLVAENSGYVAHCSSAATVAGTKYVGGIVGRNDENVTNCYNTGPVSHGRSAGGLAGANTGTITTSYSTGSVAGSYAVGGLVGDSFGGRISASFWDVQTSGRTNMCGLQRDDATGCNDSFGLTTAEMQTAAVFLDAGWDFVEETGNGTDDVWWILEGEGYPKLWWETGPQCASLPDPPSGAMHVIQPFLLSWQVPQWATHYDILLGKDESLVALGTTEDADVYCGRVPAEVSTCHPGLLEYGQTYYWRIVATQNADRSKPCNSTVWSFTTADRITGPSPADGAGSVRRPVILHWALGGPDLQLQYDVYFGADENTVANATRASTDIYRGRQAPDETTFDPGDLGSEKTYFWRIDAIENANPHSIWKGDVWRFTTARVRLPESRSQRKSQLPSWMPARTLKTKQPVARTTSGRFSKTRTIGVWGGNWRTRSQASSPSTRAHSHQHGRPGTRKGRPKRRPEGKILA